ncbi:NTE family protein [Neorhizobium galegae]|uniref:patatin-like phospholipase family protein n=1 Tax=Neorhizobium galegae TaxID=399 RepID=UPI001AEB6DBE|nr:patatin-like phospholipase family protein [Neorhizobium galegae]MBP2547861.1 NTE family protein [Neorhizobium galegae]
MTTKLSLPEHGLPLEGGAPRVAVAFGGGGARGIAHIAVIEALDEMGIRPVAIAGSSIGAIFGAGMAAGLTGAAIREHTLETVGNRTAVLNRLWSLGPSSMRDVVGGFRLGHFNLERILEAFLPADIPAGFEGLKIPLKIAVTDYYGQSEVILEEGELRPAIAASAAIPGLFMPVMIHGRVMIDGGVFNPIPYEHVMDNADIVIGVDVVGAPEGDGTHPPNRIDSVFGASQLMMQAAIALKMKLHPPHLFLRPSVNRFGVMDFLKAREILEESAPIKDELKRGLEGLLAAARA